MDEDKSKKHEEHEKHSSHAPKHAEKHVYMEHHEHAKNKNYQTAAWILGIVSVVLLVALILSIAGVFGSGSGTSGQILSASQVQAKTQAYVTSLVPGQSVAVNTVTPVGNDMYKVNLTVAGTNYVSYVSKDGMFLFPQGGIDMSSPVPAASAQAQQPTTVPKTSVPRVQLFIMAYCPYGTQAEKGILPAVRALGDKINFTIDFVDYSMHESFAPEVEENLRQYCIQKNQPAVYLKYLACFLNASNPQGLDTNTTACQQEAGVDVAAMNSCYASTDAQYNITSMMADKSTWVSGQFPQFNIEKNQNVQFGVQGSPTLVINGVQSNAGRDSESFLQGICAAFNNAPAECSQQLSTTTPGPGFGYSSTAQATAAGCGV